MLAKGLVALSLESLGILCRRHHRYRSEAVVRNIVKYDGLLRGKRGENLYRSILEMGHGGGQCTAVIDRVAKETLYDGSTRLPRTTKFPDVDPFKQAKAKTTVGEPSFPKPLCTTDHTQICPSLPAVRVRHLSPVVTLHVLGQRRDIITRPKSGL